jgi:hypothetical protein
LARSVPLSRFTPRAGGGSAFFVRRHTRMKRIVRVFVLLVALVAAACIVLIVAANLKPRSNKIPNWRLNLEQIELVKKQWADDRVGTTNDTPTFGDLRPYLPDWQTNHIFMTNGEVVDPDGGVYTIGRLDEQPSCLIDGHRIHL